MLERSRVQGLPIAPKRKMLQDPAFSDCAFSAHICSYGARVSTYCEGLLDSSNHKPAQEEQLVTWLPYDSIEAAGQCGESRVCTYASLFQLQCFGFSN